MATRKEIRRAKGAVAKAKRRWRSERRNLREARKRGAPQSEIENLEKAVDLAREEMARSQLYLDILLDDQS